MTFLTLLDAIGEDSDLPPLRRPVRGHVLCLDQARKVPETQGKTLEEIQEAWAEHDDKPQRTQGSDARRRSGLSGRDERSGTSPVVTARRCLGE